MRILFVTCVDSPWGGSEELWGQAAMLAIEANHTVIISAFRTGQVSPKMKRLQDAGATVQFRRGLINPNLTKNKRLVAMAANKLLDFIHDPYKKSFKLLPDVVVFTGACYALVNHQTLFHSAKKQKIPLIINTQVNAEYGRPLTREQGDFLREVFTYAQLSTFVSARNLHVTERHLVMKIKNAEIIRNPVNLNVIQCLPMPAGEIYRFAIVANVLVNHKGHDILLESFARVQWSQRAFSLHIYGNGVDLDYVKNLVLFFGLQNKVYFEGVAHNIEEVWKHNHILVMPSLNEGMPLAMVEAMLCGRPVVTTDVGGHIEWIQDGIHGFIADGANTNAIVKALERAWVNRAKWTEMGTHAHFRALELHDQRPDQTFLNLILQQKASPTS